MNNCPMCENKLEEDTIKHCMECNMEFYTEMKLPIWKINGIQCIRCREHTAQITLDQCGYFSICCVSCNYLIDAEREDKAELPPDFFPKEEIRTDSITSADWRNKNA